MKERTKKGLGLITVGILMLTLIMAGVVLANGQQCPPFGELGWTKIDSSDLSLYPVDNATEYCFKAGNFIVDAIPDGGFGQAGACTAEDIQNCGLSHWAYFIPFDVTEEPPTATPDPTPTDVPPTATPDPTPEDTPTEPPPTETPEITPTNVPPTQTPEKPPETGGTDGAFFDDPVFVGGLFFIAILAMAIGAVKLWERKQNHGI